MAKNIGSGLMEMSLEELRAFPRIIKKKKKKRKLTRRRGDGTNGSSHTTDRLLAQSGDTLVTQGGSPLVRA